MKTIITLILSMFAGLANAGVTVTPAAFNGAAYNPVTISVDDAGGVIRWNSRALDLNKAYVAAGACQLDYSYSTAPNPPNAINVGATCYGAGAIQATTTGSVTSTCPGDGMKLDVLSLTITLDGTEVFSQHLSQTDLICYVTAAPPPIVSWTVPVLTFVNDSARTSAAATFSVVDPAWLYSQHVFNVPAGMGCGPAKKYKVVARWVQPKPWAEVGFTCSATVPAGSALTVGVQ